MNNKISFEDAKKEKYLVKFEVNNDENSILEKQILAFISKNSGTYIEDFAAYEIELSKNRRDHLSNIISNCAKYFIEPHSYVELLCNTNYYSNFKDAIEATMSLNDHLLLEILNNDIKNLFKYYFNEGSFFFLTTYKSKNNENFIRDIHRIALLENFLEIKGNHHKLTEKGSQLYNESRIKQFSSIDEYFNKNSLLDDETFDIIERFVNFKFFHGHLKNMNEVSRFILRRSIKKLSLANNIQLKEISIKDSEYTLFIIEVDGIEIERYFIESSYLGSERVFNPYKVFDIFGRSVFGINNDELFLHKLRTINNFDPNSKDISIKTYLLKDDSVTYCRNSDIEERQNYNDYSKYHSTFKPFDQAPEKIKKVYNSLSEKGLNVMEIFHNPSAITGGWFFWGFGGTGLYYRIEFDKDTIFSFNSEESFINFPDKISTHFFQNYIHNKNLFEDNTQKDDPTAVNYNNIMNSILQESIYFNDDDISELVFFVKNLKNMLPDKYKSHI